MTWGINDEQEEATKEKKNFVDSKMRYVTLLNGAKYCKRHFNQYIFKKCIAANKTTKCNEPQNIRNIY